MPKKFTYEDVNTFVKQNSDCELISKEYLGAMKIMEFKCGCGRTFKASFNNFKNNNIRSCLVCSNKTLSFEYVKDFIERNGCKLLSDTYINSKLKLKILCCCGEVFYTTFDEFRSGNKRQCNVCGRKSATRKQRKSHDVFVAEVYKLVKDEYSILSIYVRNKDKVKIRHNNCGFIWDVNPNDFLRGSRCPNCQEHRTMKKTHNEFVQEVFELTQGEYSVLTHYVSANEYVLMKHNKCGHEWKVKPGVFCFGCRCPICAKMYSPKTERKIDKILSQNNISFQRQYTIDNCRNPLTNQLLLFDFAIFDDNDLKMLIEYDGEQHYKAIDFFGGEEALKQTQYRDSIKTNYCKQNNIPLLRIPYWDFSRIEDILSKELNTA